MPAPNHLSQKQRQNLLKIFRESESPLIRNRVMILLLMNDGKTYEEISDFLQISYPTVAYWAMQADPDQPESFTDGRSKGNFRKATEQYINLLLKIVDNKPSKYGYQFGSWTAEKLVNHLEKETGIKLSSSQVRRILKQKKADLLSEQNKAKNSDKNQKEKKMT